MAQVVCVVGPTASGKTKAGVFLAKALNGEIVSVDSMQIYRGMEIGTAAPTIEEQQGVPHHMIGVAEPEEEWSVARFVKEADQCITDILSRGRLPVLVGGTGLYLDALIRGNQFAPGEKNGETRKALQERADREGIDILYEELKKIDPEAAVRVHGNDSKRIIRALEVYYETGQTITRHNEETTRLPDRYDAVYIGLNFADRQDLRDRIDVRVDEMVASGLLGEVRSLLARGLSRNTTALQAIGYKQFLKVLDGEINEQEAIEEVKLRSRQYAKRQLTWLRRNKEIYWVEWSPECTFEQGMNNALQHIKEKLQ